MLEYVRGILAAVSESSIVVEVGGVGLSIEMPTRDMANLPGLGEEVIIYVREFVREDRVSLYGFSDPERREFFNLLVSVPSVGPNIAVALMSSISLEEILSSILTDDYERLSSVHGIGKKTAQKIVLELKDRVRKLSLRISAVSGVGGVKDGFARDVVEALVSLGFSRTEALEAFSAVMREKGKITAGVDNIIRECLKVLWDKKGVGR